MSNPWLHLRWSEEPVTQLNPLLRRQFVSGTQCMLARLELRKGCTVPRYQHHHEQISSVLRGALRFLMGEEGATVETIVREGEALVIPGHVLHAVEALEDALVLDVFAPPRTDWIAGDDAYLR